MSDDAIRKYLDEKRAEAIKLLGPKWVLKGGSKDKWMPKKELPK